MQGLQNFITVHPFAHKLFNQNAPFPYPLKLRFRSVRAGAYRSPRSHIRAHAANSHFVLQSRPLCKAQRRSGFRPSCRNVHGAASVTVCPWCQMTLTAQSRRSTIPIRMSAFGRTPIYQKWEQGAMNRIQAPNLLLEPFPNAVQKVYLIEGFGQNIVYSGFVKPLGPGQICVGRHGNDWNVALLRLHCSDF
jgi:hypothetical protein